MNALRQSSVTSLRRSNGQVTRRIFSGIQPTGVPHLGNYLGALRHWVKLQNEAQPTDRLTFCIVDWHALTARPHGRLLQQQRGEMLASLHAIGLNPKQCPIYFQSAVPYHMELMWILSCQASMGRLNRMTQWKSKLIQSGTESIEGDATSQEGLRLGLFSYPVLQAADILLHNTSDVPVGEDQVQHIELARDLATSLNHILAQSGSSSHSSSFAVPNAMLTPAKRVMSLTNPTTKMSKSDPNPNSRLLLTDTAPTIMKKVMAAITDSIPGLSYDPFSRPGVSNLLAILSHLDDSGLERTPADVASDLQSQGASMKDLKTEVVRVVEAHMQPIRQRYEEIIGSPAEFEMLMAEAREAAAEIVDEVRPTMELLKATLGLENGL